MDREIPCIETDLIFLYESPYPTTKFTERQRIMRFYFNQFVYTYIVMYLLLLQNFKRKRFFTFYTYSVFIITSFSKTFVN